MKQRQWGATSLENCGVGKPAGVRALHLPQFVVNFHHVIELRSDNEGRYKASGGGDQESHGAGIGRWKRSMLKISY